MSARAQVPYLPLLKVKLHIPLLPAGLVQRPPLIDRLNADLWRHDGVARKLTLVSAPAGFGKTTLVSEWVINLRSSATVRAPPLHQALIFLSDHLLSQLRLAVTACSDCAIAGCLYSPCKACP